MKWMVYCLLGLFLNIASASTYLLEGPNYYNYSFYTIKDCAYGDCKHHTTNMRISGEVDVRDALPASDEYFDITESVTGFYLSDGIATYRYGDSRIYRYYFYAKTDENGQITAVYGHLEQWQAASIHTPGARMNLLVFGGDGFAAYNASCAAIVNDICVLNAPYDIYTSEAWSKDVTIVARFIGDRSPVYRFFNKKAESHFFTANLAERDYVVAHFPDFTFEGVAFYTYPERAELLLPVYRLYNTIEEEHFYTLSEAEAQALVKGSAVFTPEGVGWFAMNRQLGSNLPVHRFFHTVTKSHFYTINDQEARFIRENYSTYRYENVAFRAWSTRR